MVWFGMWGGCGVLVRFWDEYGDGDGCIKECCWLNKGFFLRLMMDKVVMLGYLRLWWVVLGVVVVISENRGMCEVKMYGLFWIFRGGVFYIFVLVSRFDSISVFSVYFFSVVVL